MTSAVTVAVTILSLCGLLRTTGSEPTTQLELKTQTGSYAVSGSGIQYAVSYPGQICVNATPSRALELGVAGSLRVLSFRLLGDGHHAPIIGRLEQRDNKFYLMTNDGKRFALVGDLPSAQRLMHRRVWILATWDGNAMAVRAVGDLGPLKAG